VAAAAPVVIEPLFQRTEPLRNPVLRAQVVDLAERTGVSVDDVRVNDAGSRTTAANAYVSGVGATRRIVLYDTLVGEFPAAQVRVVVAHELAHIEARHIPKGVAWVAGLSLPVCLLLFAIVRWRTGTAAPGRDPRGCDLVVRRLAVVAAGAAIIGAVTVPLQNAVSRSFEREAEVRALDLTADPGASIALQQGLVARARAVPDPPAIVRVLFGTHPTARERIGIALAWEDARDGTP
jgi:STE24 endopeptidase